MVGTYLVAISTLLLCGLIAVVIITTFSRLDPHDGRAKSGRHKTAA